MTRQPPLVLPGDAAVSSRSTPSPATLAPSPPLPGSPPGWVVAVSQRRGQLPRWGSPGCESCGGAAREHPQHLHGTWQVPGPLPAPIQPGLLPQPLPCAHQKPLGALGARGGGGGGCCWMAEALSAHGSAPSVMLHIWLWAQGWI